MAKRVDKNQAEMVKDLRRAGFHVIHLHTLGKGAPDLVVTGYDRNRNDTVALLVEVKDEKGKLTDDEVEFHAKYPEGGPLIVARTTEQVLRWFGLI